jgi:hypothetical protein
MLADIGGPELDTPEERALSASEFFQNTLNHTAEQPVSPLVNVDALQKRWQQLGQRMTVDVVVDWVEHAIQLPQLAENFRRAAITGYDFVEITDEVLRTELNITSVLHRNQILRFVKMILMSVADEPDAPIGFHFDGPPLFAPLIVFLFHTR